MTAPEPLGDFGPGVRDNVVRAPTPGRPTPGRPTPSSPTSAGPPTKLAPTQAGHEVLGMDGHRAPVAPAPVAPAPREVAAAVPNHAAVAVATADRKAAPQPYMGEKVAAAERQIAGDEPEGTIVEGIEDDALWVMLRNFNKQVNHVLHPATSLPPAEPDLRHTNLPNVPYRSDTLKANLERLIQGLAPPASRGVQELAWLSDWDHDFRRTAAYCTSYFIAWGFGYVVMAATAFFIVLICFPDTRRLLFPYHPPESDTHPLLETEDEAALDDRSFPNVKASKAPMSGREKTEEDSVEVTAILTGFASAILFGTKEEGNAVVGPKDLIDDWDDPAMQVLDDRGRLIGFRTTRFDSQAEVVEYKGKKIRVRRNRTKDAQTEAERKRDELITWLAKGTETTLGSGADFIEIFQKALSPPAIYPDHLARFKLAGLLVVPALAMHYIPTWMWGRGATFIFGVVFWGRKWLEEGVRELIRRFPDWKQLVDPRNSVLSGVPTDAQLTLHLLRVSEAEKDPLPAPPVAPALEDTKEAIRGDSDTASEVVDPAPKGVRKVAKKGKQKTKGAFRKLGRKLAGMGSDVAVVGEERKLKGKIDSLVLKAKWGDDIPEGGYAAKLDSTSGHLFIDEEEECLSWVPLMSKTPDRVWDIDDLVEMKKDGLGVSRLALAAMSGAEIASLGLSLRFAKTADDVSLSGMSDDEQLLAAQKAKETLVFKGVEAREALFNRLVAMGNQRWEML